MFKFALIFNAWEEWMLSCRTHSILPVMCSAVILGSLSLSAQETSIYNQSAMYACENSWDITCNSDYLYWAWQQSFLPVATMITPSESGSLGLINGSKKVIFQRPGYASGFQVGLGCNFHGMDDWRFKADFTWYENTTHRTTIPQAGQYLTVANELIETPHRISVGALLSGNLRTSASMQFDELNTTVQRIFYQGKQLMAQYEMGLKTLWIDQTMKAGSSDLSFIGTNVPFVVPLAGAFTSTAKTESWALGPVFATKINWLLPYGLFVDGDFAFSLVYTSYTTLQFSIVGQITETGSADFLLSQPHHYDTVTPILEMNLGLGWGSYLCQENLYLKLFAGYDFNVYWSRNILMALMGGSQSPGSMYLQGLNIKAQIDF